MENIIKFFLGKTIPDLSRKEYNLTFIKFVFNDDALAEMSKYNEQAVNYLRNIRSNYKSGKIGETDIYIVINNYMEFFSLLNKIVLKYEKREHKSLLDSYNFIRSLWLRMSPSDLKDVNGFLKRQLAFLRNDDILSYSRNFYKKYENIDIIYENKVNEDWFETNNNVIFSFLRSDGAEGELFPVEYQYDLPSIHYAFIKENNENVCYIYGIQTLSSIKHKYVKEIIQPLRKRLRNQYVQPDFIIALKLFTDFLGSNGIHTIKVPLLQVMNYPYHESLSESIKRAYSSYENKDDLEKKYREGSNDIMVSCYIHDKEMYEKLADKADLISKNKTERLIYTFKLLSEFFDDIEVLNEPFIQGDYLIIKINKQLKKQKVNMKSIK